MHKLQMVLLVILFSAATILASPIFAAPGAIYVNGQVLTVDPEFSVAEAFAIEDGRFTLVGTDEQVRRSADETTEVFDLGGHTVIPGLIDNHNHFLRGAQHWNQLVRLDGVTTRTEALKRLRRKEAALEPGQWLLVLGGWSERQFTDTPWGFSREELDELSTVPVFIQSEYSHAFVNTAFLRHFQISPDARDTPLPPDHPALGPSLPALVERDHEGAVTGRINGGIQMVIQVGLGMPAIDTEESIAATRAAQSHYHALGLTTVYDPAGALTTDATYTAAETLHRQNELTLRVYRTLWIQPANDADVQQAIARINAAEPMFAGDDFYDTLGVGEAMYLPFHDSSDRLPHFTETGLEHVEQILTAILANGLPAQIHAVNTETIDVYLSIIEALSADFDIRPGFVTFTHAEGVSPQQMERMKKLGIALQARSSRVVDSRASLLGTLGGASLSQPPLQSLNQSGMLWGLGTDGTKAAQINPMLSLDWAVTGRAINGDVILEESERLSREEALIAHTRNNAALVFRADRLGQISPGFLADFVVLDRDYLTIAAEDIRRVKPVLTVVGGNVVYRQTP